MSNQIPRRQRMTVQAAIRRMLPNPVSRAMALVIASNLRKREETPLLRMVRDNPMVETTMLIAVTKAVKIR